MLLRQWAYRTCANKQYVRILVYSAKLLEYQLKYLLQGQWGQRRRSFASYCNTAEVRCAHLRGYVTPNIASTAVQQLLNFFGNCRLEP